MSQGAVRQWPSGPRTPDAGRGTRLLCPAPLLDNPFQGGFRVIPASASRFRFAGRWVPVAELTSCVPSCKGAWETRAQRGLPL